MIAPITKVIWTKKVAKQLDLVPAYIRRNFFVWVTSVELSGIHEVRKSLGLHDEPLKGTRHGQRSVRLNKAYRAIYIQRRNGGIEFLEILEVNKHDY